MKIQTYNSRIKNLLILILVAVFIFPISFFSNTQKVKAEGGCNEGFTGSIINDRTHQSVPFAGGWGDTMFAQPGDTLTLDTGIDTLGSGGLFSATAYGSQGGGNGHFTSAFGSPLNPPATEVGFHLFPPSNTGYYENGNLTAIYLVSGVPDHIELAASCEVSINGQHQTLSVAFELEILASSPDFNCSPITPLTTINAGSDAVLGVNTTATAGYTDWVHYEVSIAPDAGTPSGPLPILGQVSGVDTHPPSQTTVFIATYPDTAPGSYTITFRGNGGGYIHSCHPKLVVNPSNANFNLILSPTSEAVGIPASQHTPNRVLSGNSKVFTIFAECTGGFTGPITNLVAQSEFVNVDLVINRPDTGDPNGRVLNCGATTTLTVDNTSSIQNVDLSSPSGNVLLKNITVSGNGVIN